jgi:hypothetical protein
LFCNTLSVNFRAVKKQSRNGKENNIPFKPEASKEEPVKITKWLRIAVPVLFLGTALSAKNNDNNTLTNVPANPKVVGQSSPNVLSPELIEVIVGQGSVRLENSSALTSYYGYDNDVLAMQPDFPRMLPAPGTVAEATKTEPDKNTYLVLRGQDGADPRYDYGTHFLFQGHEAGVNSQSYITRINLDADGPHRITLMATADTNGRPLPPIDGSVWYPFSNHLLFSSEQGSPNGGIWQATTDFPSKVEDLRGVIGSSAYEGMQADNHGNIIIAEDSSGSSGSAAANLSHAKQPNSFIYRFIPYNTSDLKLGGAASIAGHIEGARRPTYRISCRSCRRRYPVPGYERSTHLRSCVPDQLGADSRHGKRRVCLVQCECTGEDSAGHTVQAS